MAQSKEELKEKRKLFYAANRDRILKNKRDKYHANVEHARELGRKNMRRQRAKDPERAREYTREWYRSHPGAYKKYRLQSLYGISSTESLHASQDGRCAICLKDGPLVVDHCHQSGSVRGLLCNNCNSGIGMLCDSVENVRRALDYLSKEAA